MDCDMGLHNQLLKINNMIISLQFNLQFIRHNDIIDSHVYNVEHY